jgi:hypothetical protein
MVIFFLPVLAEHTLRGAGQDLLIGLCIGYIKGIYLYVKLEIPIFKGSWTGDSDQKKA